MEKNVEEENVVSVTNNTAWVAQKSLPLKMLWLGFAFLWLSAMVMILFFKLGQANDLSIWLALKVYLANLVGKAGVFSLAMLLPVICYRGIARLLAKGTVVRYEWMLVGIGSLLVVVALANTIIKTPYGFVGFHANESEKLPLPHSEQIAPIYGIPHVENCFLAWDGFNFILAKPDQLEKYEIINVDNKKQGVQVFIEKGLSIESMGKIMDDNYKFIERLCRVVKN